MQAVFEDLGARSRGYGEPPCSERKKIDLACGYSADRCIVGSVTGTADIAG
jgi:hypothetical protein